MTETQRLSDEEIERYARHIVLPQMGGAGQQKLKAASALIIGAGGLGAPAILYLAAAGIGRLVVVDDDHVSLSNLQRQIIHDSSKIGQAKVESAKDRIAEINPHVTLEPVETRITAENADDLISDCDIVLDGSDNFDTRYLVADRCEALKKPLVTGAVGRFDGSITVLRPWEFDAENQQNPSYRDLFPQKPENGSVPTCAQAGVLGALTGVIGTLMAMEAIKDILKMGDTLIGRLLLYDALGARMETIRYKRQTPKS